MQVQEMVFCDKIKCIFVTVHFIFLRLNENIIYAIFVVILPAIIKVVWDICRYLCGLIKSIL